MTSFLSLSYAFPFLFIQLPPYFLFERRVPLLTERRILRMTDFRKFTFNLYFLVQNRNKPDYHARQNRSVLHFPQQTAVISDKYTYLLHMHGQFTARHWLIRPILVQCSIITLPVIGLRKHLVNGQLHDDQFSVLFIGQPATHLRHHSVQAVHCCNSWLLPAFGTKAVEYDRLR